MNSTRLAIWAAVVLFPAFVGATAPEPASVKGNASSIRFDGLYASRVIYGEITSRTFARFYPNGDVLYVSYAGKLKPEEVQKRMFKDGVEGMGIYAGTYQIEGDRVSIAVANKQGSLMMTGKLEGEVLILGDRLFFAPWSQKHELPPDVEAQPPQR
jgi:hypothetical protein